jgi:Ran GTPase-activating protein (RanGAP) involved in mRNA processing and transport
MLLLLSTAIQTNNSLRELDLRENMLGGTGMAALAAAIKDHPSLDTLHLEVLLPLLHSNYNHCL